MRLLNRIALGGFLISAMVCHSCAAVSSNVDPQSMFDQAEANAKKNHSEILQDKLNVSLQGLPLQTIYAASPPSAPSDDLLFQLGQMAHTVKLTTKYAGYSERTLQIEISADDSKKLLTALWNREMAQAENKKANLLLLQGEKLTAKQAKQLNDQLNETIGEMKSKLDDILPTLRVASVYYLIIDRKTGQPLRLLSDSNWNYARASGNSEETVTNTYIFHPQMLQ